MLQTIFREKNIKNLEILRKKRKYDPKYEWAEICLVNQLTQIANTNQKTIFFEVSEIMYLCNWMFKDPNISIGNKILTTVICFACLAIPFIIGIYLIVLAAIALVGFVALWTAGKIWWASQKANREYPDLIETMMGLDGRKGPKSDYDTIDSEDGKLYVHKRGMFFLCMFLFQRMLASIRPPNS